MPLCIVCIVVFRGRVLAEGKGLQRVKDNQEDPVVGRPQWLGAWLEWLHGFIHPGPGSEGLLPDLVGDSDQLVDARNGRGDVCHID